MLRGAAAGTLLSGARIAIAGEPLIPIFDAHVHVWDLKQFHLPWLDHNTPLLKRDYLVADYLKAAAGLNVIGAAYIEVNVEPGQRRAEADYVVDLCRRREAPFAAGVIAGDPRDPDFRQYLDHFKGQSSICGVRFLYPAGASADPAFIRGMRALGERNVTFDLQLNVGVLEDAAKSVEACTDTRFVLDHCGGADPRPFRKAFGNDASAKRFRDAWRRGIAALAKRPNVWCKISGVADAALPDDATSGDVDPVVNFCLDQFGPDRVLFGGNWPVCLKGTTLRLWVESLRRIVAGRKGTDRRKLFHDNAVKVYRISDPDKLVPR